MEVPLYCVLWRGCVYVGRGCRVSPNASPDYDLGMGKQPKEGGGRPYTFMVPILVTGDVNMILYSCVNVNKHA